jgi:hypothetical protein
MRGEDWDAPKTSLFTHALLLSLLPRTVPRHRDHRGPPATVAPEMRHIGGATPTFVTCGIVICGNSKAG